VDGPETSFKAVEGCIIKAILVLEVIGFRIRSFLKVIFGKDIKYPLMRSEPVNQRRRMNRSKDHPPFIVACTLTSDH